MDIKTKDKYKKKIFFLNSFDNKKLILFKKENFVSIKFIELNKNLYIYFFFTIILLGNKRNL